MLYIAGMERTELLNLLGDNYYRSGIPDDEKETIIFLPKEEIEELKKSIISWYKDSCWTIVGDTSTMDFTKFEIWGIGKVTLVESKEFKIFQKLYFMYKGQHKGIDRV